MTRGIERWSVKLYDNERKGNDGRPLCVYRAWPVGRPDLKATISEASKLMRGRPGMYLVVRLDERFPLDRESEVERVLSAMVP